VVCGRVPKFGSGICLYGDLVLEFNYFKKFQVFKYSNPFGLVPAKVVPRNEIWWEVILKWRDSLEQPLESQWRSFFRKLDFPVIYFDS
jgi:hypothetical protein